MKVYILITYSGKGFNIVDVFSSIEKAEAVKKVLSKSGVLEIHEKELK